jgi:fengycin family lipopeptide synthetase C
MTSSFGFDVTTFEIFGPLLNGAALYMADKETFLDSHQLETYIHQNGITTLWLTSPLFNHLTEQNENTFAGLSTLIIGGEALSASHVNRIRKACPSLKIRRSQPALRLRDTTSIQYRLAVLLEIQQLIY